MKSHGRIFYYESKLRLLNAPNFDMHLLEMACRDAPVKASGLSDRRSYERFVKSRKYYQKKIELIVRMSKRLAAAISSSTFKAGTERPGLNTITLLPRFCGRLRSSRSSCYFRIFLKTRR
jgi:hypothetical protein